MLIPYKNIIVFFLLRNSIENAKPTMAECKKLKTLKIIFHKQKYFGQW